MTTGTRGVRGTHGRALALALVTLAACSSHQVVLVHQAPPTFSQEPAGYETATVSRVIDGDTIEVAVTATADGPGAGGLDPGTYKVRLIGIDTPESVKPGTPVECYAKEASAATHALLAGLEVRLVKDVENTDRYERLLRYVYIEDEMANARLVANGYALAYTYPPNIRWSELFVQLQREARADDRGLWKPETCDGEE